MALLTDWGGDCWLPSTRIEHNNHDVRIFTASYLLSQLYLPKAPSTGMGSRIQSECEVMITKLSEKISLINKWLDLFRFGFKTLLIFDRGRRQREHVFISRLTQTFIYEKLSGRTAFNSCTTLSRRMGLMFSCFTFDDGCECSRPRWYRSA